MLGRVPLKAGCFYGWNPFYERHGLSRDNLAYSPDPVSEMPVMSNLPRASKARLYGLLKFSA